MATSSVAAAARRRLTGVARGGAFAIARHSLRGVSCDCAIAGAIRKPSAAKTAETWRSMAGSVRRPVTVSPNDDPNYHGRINRSSGTVRELQACRHARLPRSGWSRFAMSMPACSTSPITRRDRPTDRSRCCCTGFPMISIPTSMLRRCSPRRVAASSFPICAAMGRRVSSIRQRCAPASRRRSEPT